MLHEKLEKAYKLAAVKGLYRISRRIMDVEIMTLKGMGTCCTDGSRIIIDPVFLEKLSVQETLFIISHEYYHIIYDHVRRAKEKEFNPIIYNIACDAVINEHLVKAVKLAKPSDDTGGIFLDNELFKEMPTEYDTSEKIYRWLMENQDRIDESHMMGDISFGDEKNADTDQEVAMLNRIDRGYEAGKEISEAFGTKEEPCNWMPLTKAMQIECGRLVKREIAHNYSRPSRREGFSDVILPSSRHVVAMPKIDVYIDISGSMGDSPLSIFNGLRSILSSLSVYRPKFYVFNTKITEIDIKAKTLPLGGGTDIKLVLKDIKADLAIVITDCEDNVTRADFKKNVIVVSNNFGMADYVTKDWINVKKKEN